MNSHILVGVDGSAQGDKAFDFALSMTPAQDASLTICAVIYGAEIEMAEAGEREALVQRRREHLSAHLDQLVERAGMAAGRLQPRLLEGHPVEELLKLAEQERVDHIVVGHRSKGLFERLLMGSVAKRVVDFARCTVTVVR